MRFKKMSEIEITSNILGDEVTTCIIQLKSPFYDEMSEVRVGIENVLAWDKDKGNLDKKTDDYNRDEKIFNIINSLFDDSIYSKKIDIIVLPEYSMCWDAIDKLKTISYNRKIIFIAGFYDHQLRKSVAAVIIPSEKESIVYFQYKLSIATNEENFIDHENNDIEFYKFYWKFNNNGQESKSYLYVLICLDFLTHSLDVIDFNYPGFVIVPMNSPNIDSFYGLSQYLIRKNIDNGSLSVLLCNATDIANQQGLKICGGSQIVGPSNSKLPIIEQFNEGGIISRIKMAATLSKPTKIDKESFVISSQTKFTIEPNGNIKSKAIVDEKFIVVNPNIIIKEIGLHKIYTLFVADNYYKFRTHLKNTCFPIKCNGIYGTYDILMQSYEENWNFFDLRIGYYLGFEYEQITKEKHPEYFEITDVIKYRGKILAEITPTEYLPIDELTLASTNLIDHVNDIKNIMIGDSLSSAKIKNLLKRKIIFEVDSKSDLFDCEKQSGMEEYLLFLFLNPNHKTDERSVISAFQSNVLEILIKDNRVRTIEFCKDGGSNGAKTCKGTYIFHLVGRLDDLKDIIINNIHKSLYDNSIQCGTRVIPTAESITEDSFESLNETIIGQKHQKTVLKIIKSLSSYPGPFCLKKLPLDMISDICFLVILYNEYIEHKDKECKDCCGSNEIGFFNLKKELELNLYKFIHFICSTLKNSQQLNPIIYENFKVYCSNIYNFLGNEIERKLVDIVNEIKNIISDSDNKNSYLEKFVSKNIDINKSTTILGDLIKFIVTWNKHVADQCDKIGDNSFNDELNKLNDFISYRNYYSHSFDEDRLKDMTIDKFAKKTLLCSISSLKFLTRDERK